MSGGAYDYAYSRLNDFAEEVALVEGEPGHADRVWLVGLIGLVAKAMKDIEWVDSCDRKPGDEIEAITRVREYTTTQQ